MIQTAILDDDLIVGRMTGIDSGPPIPPELADLPDPALRFNGNALIDARQVATWHIDSGGNKHLKAGAGRQPLACAWDARLVKRDNVWGVMSSAEMIAPAIKAECKRRISETLKDLTTQTNIQAYVLDLLVHLSAGNVLSPEQQSDIALAQALKAWVAEMQAASRDLIAAGDAAYGLDTKWPAPPNGARPFVDRF